jgi:hypothetical protein
MDDRQSSTTPVPRADVATVGSTKKGSSKRPPVAPAQTLTAMTAEEEAFILAAKVCCAVD